MLEITSLGSSSRTQQGSLGVERLWSRLELVEHPIPGYFPLRRRLWSGGPGAVHIVVTTELSRATKPPQLKFRPLLSGTVGPEAW